MGALSDVGRFSEPALLVLVSLLDGPKHGYAIAEDVARFAGRRLGPGTLYGAVGRLERLGLVRALSEDGRRRPYELTPAGVGEVRYVLAEMSALAASGRRRLRRLGTT